MRYVFLIFLFLGVFSCRTFPEYPVVYNYVYDSEAYFKGKDCSFVGKIVYKGKPLWVSIKIAVDSTYCEPSFADFDGLFSFCLDTTKVTDNSYIQFVAEGYEPKRLWLRKFLKSDKVVELKKGSVTREEWMRFHEGIRFCALFNDIVTAPEDEI